MCQVTCKPACVCVCVCHTLVHHYKSEDSTVVAVLLFLIPREADVVSFVFKGDVPQQDGDVAGL